MSTPLHCLGALALELSADTPAGRGSLDREAAAALGTALADDLQRLLGGVEALDCGFACALYDPAELLRPGWPVHASLAELSQAAPGMRGGRVIAFGAHEGRMSTDALQPDPRLGGGALRLLPFVLLGDPAAVRAVGEQMESQLLDVGMAGAQIALDCQSAFGLRLEHARWMSLHDLCAMTAMQYDHAGLAGCWRMIEAALLTPDADEWLDEPGEPLALYRAGEVRVAVPTSTGDTAIESRQRRRQLLAILGAHGLPCSEIEVAAGDDPAKALKPTVQ